MNPPGAICNRCRQGIPSVGDSWCTACTAWEGLGRELAGHWDTSGCRVIAADLVLSCAKQVRALRSLGAGLSRSEGPAEGTRATSAGDSRALRKGPASEAPRSPDRRGSLPRRRVEAPPPPPPVAKREEEEEYEYEESGEEEADELDPNHTPLGGGGGDRRPPEPKDPPKEPSKRESTAGAGESRARRRSRSRKRSSRHHHTRSRDRDKKKHRAGRKHQRLHRLASNPLLQVHRKPPNDFWELDTSLEGRLPLRFPHTEPWSS